ncbi:MAG: hypothetical protein KDD69_04155 [Bdellovibrionales bacterium]|nr:hypothetical protein [Bdellovibrionales bacterium]
MKATTLVAVAFGFAGAAAAVSFGSARDASANLAFYAAEAQFAETLRTADDSVAFVRSVFTVRPYEESQIVAAAEKHGIELSQAEAFLAELEVSRVASD